MGSISSRPVVEGAPQMFGRNSPIGVGQVTIANGESLSDAIDLEIFRLAAVQMPAAWTSAGLSFQGSVDGVTYGDLKFEGYEYLVGTVAANDFIPIDLRVFLNTRFLKVRSGTSSLPVAQGAARSIKLELA